MKKYIMTTLILIMCLCTACGKNDSGNKENTSTVTDAAVKEVTEKDTEASTEKADKKNKTSDKDKDVKKNSKESKTESKTEAKTTETEKADSSKKKAEDSQKKTNDSKNTTKATEAATERATEAKTQAPTEGATQAPTQAPTEASTQAPTENAACSHNWVWKTHTETVHHDAVTKEEPYYGDPWDEAVYVTKIRCGKCGVYYDSMDAYNTYDTCMSGFGSEQVIDHYIHHDGDLLGYRTVTVSEAYDETVTVNDYQYCSKCGARK